MDLTKIRLLVLDVDGVLTDGRLLPSAGADDRAALELGGKAFHVQDGHAVKMWQNAGGLTAIMTGRRSSMVDTRAAELKVRCVLTGVEDKMSSYKQLLIETECVDEQVACVGDDLPDIPLLRQCGFPIAVANALPAVKQHAQYVTRRPGGGGAIAEIVELLLRKQGRWKPDTSLES